MRQRKAPSGGRARPGRTRKGRQSAYVSTGDGGPYAAFGTLGTLSLRLLQLLWIRCRQQRQRSVDRSAKTPEQKNRQAESRQGSRQQQSQGWKSNQGKRRGWSSYSWDSQQQRRSQQPHTDHAMEENLKLLARLCLRHEHELSQTKVERDVVPTLETQEAAVLSCTTWQWSGEGRKRIRRWTARSGCVFSWGCFRFGWRECRPPRDGLKTRIIELGYAQMPEGTTELQWFYMRWNASTRAMESIPGMEPMLQSSGDHVDSGAGHNSGSPMHCSAFTRQKGWRPCTRERR